MPYRAEDGSLLNDDGEVMFFSKQRFVEEICEGDNCFLCGKHRNGNIFNDEHVIPQWLLRKFNMFRETITLPNGTYIRYDQYTIPCCVDCNGFLGRELEEPIADLLSNGMDHCVEVLQRTGSALLFVWLGLLFFKTHYKDRALRMHLDQRLPAEKISDLYEWEDLHHIHCLIRAIYVGQEIEREVFGTLCIFATKTASYYSHFDYHDLYHARSVMLRIGEIGIVGVLNDSGAAYSVFEDKHERISGPLSPLQLREVLAHLSYINMYLKERPRYASLVSEDGAFVMVAERPEVIYLDEPNNEFFGGLVEACCGPLLRDMRLPNQEEILENVRNLRWSSLFDDEDGFQRNSMDPL